MYDICQQPVSIFHGEMNGISLVLLRVGVNECEHVVYFVKIFTAFSRLVNLLLDFDEVHLLTV